MYKKIKENNQSSFYPVEPKMIQKAESNMGIKFPSSLFEFYLTVGYGFLETHLHNINRIMGPSSVEEFYFGIGQFQNIEEIEIFREYKKDKLYFFEVTESLYLSIGISKNNDGKIYYFDEVIADNLNEFFNKYSKDEKYFLDE